jgi:hypothetical protein
MLTKIGSALAWLLLVIPIGCQGESSSDHDEYVLIDDMGDALPDGGGATGFQVQWHVSTSRTCQTDRIQPPPYLPDSGEANRWTFQPREPGETMQGVRSNWAAHLWTTPDGLETAPTSWEDERCWGANMTVDLTQVSEVDGGGGDAPPADIDAGTADTAPGTPTDLSAYSGLLFWAKASSAMDRRIQVLLQDGNSDQRGGLCGIRPDGGAEGDSSEQCYNGFSTSIDLSSSFAPYRVDFSEMWRDPTWGHTPDPYKPDLEHVYQIAFQVNAPKCVADKNAKCVSDHVPLKFDFWIDDLYLVKPK